MLFVPHGAIKALFGRIVPCVFVHQFLWILAVGFSRPCCTVQHFERLKFSEDAGVLLVMQILSIHMQQTTSCSTMSSHSSFSFNLASVSLHLIRAGADMIHIKGLSEPRHSHHLDGITIKTSFYY